MPKLQDLDLALGLGGPTTGPKKVIAIVFLSFGMKFVARCVVSVQTPSKFET